MYVQRENPEWVNYWWDIADDATIKRWLLIGDSVARQFRGVMQSLVPEKISIDFLGMSFSVLDEAFVREIEHFFSYEEYSYDLVILNSGFHHGFGVRGSLSKSAYEIYDERFERIINILREKCADIVLLSGTPEVNESDLTSLNEDINTEIEIRNKIVKRIALNNSYLYIDLFDYIMKAESSFSYVDRFHFERVVDYHIANIIIRNIYGIQHDSQKNKIIQSGQRITNARVFELLLKEKPVVFFGIGKNARQLYRYINDRGGSVIFAIVSDGEATDSAFLPKVFCYSDVDFKERDWNLLVTVKNSSDIERQLSNDAVSYITIDDSLMEFVIKYNEAFLL